MAADQVGLMRALGFPRFRLVGHDRGARVSRRLAKDHPEAVEKLAILDIVPTAHIYGNVSREVARNLWHWFFLALPAPVAEALMGPQAAVFVRFSGRLSGTDAAAVAAMEKTNGTAEAFHAMCADYRAGAGVDLEHDSADASRPIEAPTLVLWGETSSSTGAVFDVPAAWAGEARDIRFASVPCGHFLAEEMPDETRDALLAFL
jgi:haloacetate dehalogenase